MNESVNHKNILAIQAYNVETRKLVRELGKKIDVLEVLTSKIDELETSIKFLQVKVYSGKATNGP